MKSRIRGSNKHFLLLIELIKILDGNFQPIKERILTKELFGHRCEWNLFEVKYAFKVERVN